MRRFAQDQLLAPVAHAGGLSTPVIFELAAHIAEFHDKAEPRPNHGGAAVMQEVAATNLRILRERRAAGYDAAQIEALAARIEEELARCAALLDARRVRGKVRRCHGDLHLRNICVYDGKLLLFDCIEFSEPIASIDVLYDLAFLLMDLVHCGERHFANLLLNRYLDLAGEDDGLAAMPLFMALRAVIRAHVTASAAEHGRSGGERAAVFAAVAAEAGVAFSGVWLDTPADAMRARIESRRSDASDATAAVLQQQLQSDPGMLDWVRVDASGNPEQTLATERRALAI